MSERQEEAAVDFITEGLKALARTTHFEPRSHAHGTTPVERSMNCAALMESMLLGAAELARLVHEDAERRWRRELEETRCAALDKEARQKGDAADVAE